MASYDDSPVTFRRRTTDETPSTLGQILTVPGGVSTLSRDDGSLKIQFWSRSFGPTEAYKFTSLKRGWYKRDTAYYPIIAFYVKDGASWVPQDITNERNNNAFELVFSGGSWSWKTIFLSDFEGGWFEYVGAESRYHITTRKTSFDEVIAPDHSIYTPPIFGLQDVFLSGWTIKHYRDVVVPSIGTFTKEAPGELTTYLNKSNSGNLIQDLPRDILNGLLDTGKTIIATTTETGLILGNNILATLLSSMESLLGVDTETAKNLLITAGILVGGYLVLSVVATVKAALK